jgi:hypothetical protein
MTNALTRTAAAILTAISILMTGAIGAAQAHHSTAHTIGTQRNSPGR